MRVDSPRWEQLNPSSFAHEQDGLHELASYLPDADPYHVWANVEFVGTDGSINEVDALVLTPSGLFVVELKHWQGEIWGDGIQWVRRMPNGRQTPEDNPYILANRKAKRLAGLIRFYARKQGKEALTPYVGAAVFLHARDLRTRFDEVGRQGVYGLHANSAGLDSLQQFVLARPVQQQRLVDAQRGRQIIELVKGAKIRPSVADRRIGQLILHPRPFAEGVGWQDFLAGHSMNTSVVRRVRFYLTSRAAEEDVPIIRRAADREFRLLQGINHPGIAHPVDLVDHSFGPAVVFDHTADSVRLDQWLVQRERKLTLAQKLDLVQDLAEIVEYAHSRRLSHRALHPRAVVVANADKPRPHLSVIDWQTGGSIAGATQVTRLSSTADGAGLELFFDDEVRRYQAPESTVSAQASGVLLDVFGLGATAYRIFAGNAPAETAEELLSAVRNRGLNLAAVVDGMPDSLVTLIYDATHGDPGQRLRSISEFRRKLEEVWEEITAPEPEAVTDPLSAAKHDVLDGGLTVLRRLGSGATATALLVWRGDGDKRQELVLKVARDEQHADRLAAEAESLSKLKYAHIASLVEGPVTVGGRTALLLESAGPRTLAEELQSGRLALEMLERYGRDLLDILTYLDSQGVWHRDLKPANLAARPRTKDKQLHLCAFDFSLASASADQLTAGTPPYLDPFLGGKRPRYDAAAERFAAAVTLYEMATGQLPRWGDNANPAAIDDEVALEPTAFDPAIADRLITFFAKALARDAAQRFDTVEEMADAWRAIFRNIPKLPAIPVTGPTSITRDTPLDATDLTVRARSALERLGVHTVGDLLDYKPADLTRAQGVPDATRKEIRAVTRTLQAQFGAIPAAPLVAADKPIAQGVEAVCANLLAETSDKDRGPMKVLLGQAATADGMYLRWPAQSEAARGTGQTQPQISVLLRKHARMWLDNAALCQVRDEIVALLKTRGAVMSSDELAEALIAARGSFTTGPGRLPQAIGLVRAAVEVELARGGDARVAIHRFRKGSDTVLVGLEPDDPASLITAANLLDHAVELGQRAGKVAAEDPLLPRQRAIEELRAVAVPDGMPALADQRLLQLAAAASNGMAAVSAQGLIYPVGMPAERALRLSASALTGQRLTEDALRERIQARFPQAQPLPSRPALERLVQDCGVPLLWDGVSQSFVPPTWQSQPTSTRVVTNYAPLPTANDAAEADRRLEATIERRGYLAVMTALRNLAKARVKLMNRHGLVELDVTAVMLEKLQALGFPWEAIVAADSGKAADADFRGLTELFQHHVVPAISDALELDRPLLITEPAPLARYGQMHVLQQLTDPTRSRPAARLLLLPARRPEPVMLDQAQVPLTSPASQSLWLPDTWLDANHAAPKARLAGTLKGALR
ncbi:BREX system serine/threonine kinase PglW [Catellatospora sichuanensis]|uniref:BREX system serine/threonine kinase PglW n=1 Tax=Catellatospora sichuanensis TaxID=1969805 RepID=UPI00118227E9|nr:BREX system serine/threonine kinase PglW [Catellatospora sichuanensis]